jgi:hypothetical protein
MEEPLKSARLIGVLTAVLLGTALFAVPALAVEEEEGPPAGHGELPSIDEVGTQNEVSREFFPERYEPPGITPKLVYPLLIVAFVATFVILALYLVWQPHFAQERKRKQRR